MARSCGNSVRIVISCAVAALLSGCAATGVAGIGANGLPGQVLGLPAATSAQLVNAEIADISSIVQALQALKALLDGIVLPSIPVTPSPAPTPGGPVVTPNRR